MPPLHVDTKAEMLAHKIKHYLITSMGVTLDEASAEEFYRAFSLTLREEVMINWTAMIHTLRKNKPRMIYYLCMEYMPGRLLGNNITNIQATHLIRLVMKKMNRNFEEELQYETDPGLGNGGLGRLASCFLDSLATQNYPALAYGLRYQYGIFDQEIWNGEQVERPDNWLLHENPHEFRRDVHAASVYFGGRIVAAQNKKGVEVYDLADYEEVRALAYDIPIIGYKEEHDFSVVTLRLWTTKESPRNFLLQRFNAGQIGQAAENTSLTDVLYPNDNNEMGKRIRLKQEFLLASASLHDMVQAHLKRFGDMDAFADKVRIQINDTHAALLIPELQRMLIREFDFGWDEAWEVVKTCCGFTNHTILRESLEEWNQNRLHYMLPRQYHIIERLNLDFCNQVRQKYPADEERVRRMSIIEGGQVRMAHLAIYGARRVNGVAELHSEILKKVVFKDFSEMYPDKFLNVTNGVTQRRWLLHCNPLLAALITKCIGNQWITHFPHIRELAKYASDLEIQREFLQVKRECKRALRAFLSAYNPLRDAEGKETDGYSLLDEEALYDVQIKRIHEYKRQLMNALHILMLYHELKQDPAARPIKRQVLIAGKAAPGYEIAKQIIRLIYCIARTIHSDPAVHARLRVVFVENYNVTRAEQIIPAADLSEQISTAGMEASGTGNMKLAMNGALTIATEDGANVEMHQAVGDQWWPFVFGKSAEQIATMKESRSYRPWDIYAQDREIQRAVDALKDRSLVQSEEEHQALCNLHQTLLEGAADPFFVLCDLRSYHDTQKRVEALYSNPSLWAEHALRNIAAMGRFSTDEAIHKYAREVWEIQPCLVDPKELSRVRDEYSEHDKCRII